MDLCQRPKRAFSISTEKGKNKNNMDSICVNALNGLFPFLQYQVTNESVMVGGVNALNGLFPFLLEKVTKIMDENGAVCQRPKRAFSISTVPSKTPHKHWLSSPVFAGICLNILIITVF